MHMLIYVLIPYRRGFLAFCPTDNGTYYPCRLPLVLLAVWIVTRGYNLFENSAKYIDIQNKVVRERLSGLRVIRAFNRGIPNITG